MIREYQTHPHPDPKMALKAVLGVDFYSVVVVVVVVGLDEYVYLSA